MGRRLRQLTIPDAAKGLTTNIDELPSGLFIKVQSADRFYGGEIGERVKIK